MSDSEIEKLADEADECYRRSDFEGVDSGTRVTFRYEVELHGFFKLVKPLVMSMGKRQLEGDFPKLKGLMVAGAL